MFVKSVSDLTSVFIGRKRAFYSNITIKGEASKEKNINISSLKIQILKIWDTLFELIQIEVQCSQNYFKISLSQEAGASEYNTE